MKRLLAILVMFYIFSSPVLCIADDFGLKDLRCDSGLISIGASKAEVLSSCGKPSAKSTSPNSVETWTYNFGPANYTYFLKFEGEQLQKIVQGDRGQ